jgi:hypothetical protein
VATAARLEPEMAPKMALATMTLEAMLPGRLPNIFSAPLNRLPMMPVFENIAPMKTNRGMAVKVKLFMISKAARGK